MRIMTANIWGDYFGNPVSMREGAIEEIIRKYSPDVVGIQEITKGWYESNLFKNLSDEYILIEGWIGNYTPILLKKSDFDVIERGWEIFSQTPDSSKSITWLVLRNKLTQKSIAVCNAHLWWMENCDEDEKLRVKNSMQLLERARLLKEKYAIPVFALGDFNCGEGSEAFKYLNDNKFCEAYKEAEEFTNVSSYHGDPVMGLDGKYHGKKTNNKISASLDHILTFKEQVCIKKYNVIEDSIILDATDHSPVYVDVEIV